MNNERIMQENLKQLCFIILLLSFGCTSYHNKTSVDEVKAQTDPLTLVSGELEAVFIDNSAYGETHRAGYNGIAELIHDEQDSTLFVPFYAGFNIEHIFGGDSLIELFEPRRYPMHLERIDESSVLLHQSETPLSHMESWTTFTLIPPHYIDVDFRCIFHSDEFFQHGYAGIFWASYINEPTDKKIYFYGRDKESAYQWLEGWSPKHGIKGTHLSKQDNNHLFMASNFNITLANDFSDFLFEKPYYYGRFHNMVFAYLFDVPENSLIRFSQSPTGGGEKNPAWDFQFIIPNVEEKTQYTFSARLVYKKFVGQEDITDEYDQWSKIQNQQNQNR